MNDTKSVLTAIFTDFVKQKAFSPEVIAYENNAWVIRRSILGLPDAAVYQGDDKLITALVDGAMTKHVGLTGLRSAG